ncbi:MULTISPECIES: hypothetical protein [unclassified Streptomyces]|uniref:hypothetical protein n=1 Tax=unclassified Streptomyces TaxID=2593676 RepID=UPI0037F56E34
MPMSEGGPYSGGCGFDLSQTRTLSLPARHPALAAQAQLMDIITSGTAAFGSYEPSPQPAQMALADIRALGGRVLADLPAHIIADLVPPDLTGPHFTAEPVPDSLSGRLTGQVSWPRREP